MHLETKQSYFTKSSQVKQLKHALQSGTSKASSVKLICSGLIVTEQT